MRWSRRITKSIKSYTQTKKKMWKKLLVKVALSVVVDVLISVAEQRYQDAEKDVSRYRWLNIIEFLNEVKTIGIP